MWLIAYYKPTGLFSLRSSATTNMGGKTLLVPTMYAVKMALLDVAYRAGYTVDSLFGVIRDLTIRFSPPNRAVVTHSFVRMLRKDRSGNSEFISAPVYREFVHFDGVLAIAFLLGARENEQVTHSREAEEVLMHLLPLVNYFGKRGSFFQFLSVEKADELGSEFSFVVGDRRTNLPGDHILQYLDDMSPTMTLQRANTYSSAAVRLGKDRVFVPVAIPYRLAATSHGYSAYVRPGTGEYC